VLPLAEGPANVEHMIDDAPGLLERAAERACRLVEVGCVISSTRTGGGSLGPG
jgi:hypothetical protein